MMSKNALLALVLPLSLSTALARVQVIPKAEIDIKAMKKNESRFVLKNAKGKLIENLLTNPPSNWFNLSPAEGAEGVRSEEVYMTFGMPKSEEIIVAVIDSGVDVNHEDLQGKIWVNSDEIANNEIDDDKNGYIDDIFGWNFIGGSNGMATIEGNRLIRGNAAAQIDADTLEVTRELVRMKKLKARTEELGEELSPAQAKFLEKVQGEVSSALKQAESTVSEYSTSLSNFKENEAILRAAGVPEMTIDALRTLESTDAAVLAAKKNMLNLLLNGLSEARLNRVIEYYGDQIRYFYNEEFNPRPKVGDNYADPNEKFYGNNDVTGPDSSHGTHVSGIIAALRDNGIGMKGVATNVKIMAVRVVPNGDERDKDVANGVRYAVDNGAKIINMSFGKAYSPYKKVVDDAFRYAEEKGVLVIHAAGNDSKDNDILPSYPSRFDQKQNREFSHWLEIGASGFKKGRALPADFTNYGKKTVDFFAPGVDILSTTPDNTYDSYSGTSMATPVVAGVAALALSFDSGLEADELKALLLDTSRRYPKFRVNLPGGGEQVLFSSLSHKGTIVDALEAVKVLK